MPVQEFRDFEEARRALWVSPGQFDLASRIKGIWMFSARLAPRQIPRGVRKFRSSEEANRERDQWIEVLFAPREPCHEFRGDLLRHRPILIAWFASGRSGAKIIFSHFQLSDYLAPFLSSLDGSPQTMD
jgi:hypothetical protein